MAIDEDSALEAVITNEELIAERDALLSDIQLIAKRLAGEASSREWCGEYERFIEELNGELKTPWMQRIRMPRTFSFVVDVQLTCDRFDVATIHEELRKLLELTHFGIVNDVEDASTEVRSR